MFCLPVLSLSKQALSISFSTKLLLYFLRQCSLLLHMTIHNIKCLGINLNVIV